MLCTGSLDHSSDYVQHIRYEMDVLDVLVKLCGQIFLTRREVAAATGKDQVLAGLVLNEVILVHW